MGGVFFFFITFATNYAFKPPTISRLREQSKRVETDCTDIVVIIDLFQSVLLGICSVMSDPNPDYPMEPDIAHLYKTDRSPRSHGKGVDEEVSNCF